MLFFHATRTHRWFVYARGINFDGEITPLMATSIVSGQHEKGCALLFFHSASNLIDFGVQVVFKNYFDLSRLISCKGRKKLSQVHPSSLLLLGIFIINK